MLLVKQPRRTWSDALPFWYSLVHTERLLLSIMVVIRSGTLLLLI
jgi:hypothetical protein